MYVKQQHGAQHIQECNTWQGPLLSLGTHRHAQAGRHPSNPLPKASAHRNAHHPLQLGSPAVMERLQLWLQQHEQHHKEENERHGAGSGRHYG